MLLVYDLHQTKTTCTSASFMLLMIHVIQLTFNVQINTNQACVHKYDTMLLRTLL